MASARSSAPHGARVGRITRGTTGTNRLRRIDRWIARHPTLRRAEDPLVVDLGYGASGVTALELAARLARTRRDVEVLGLEIDPERVRRAEAQLAAVRAGNTPFPRDLRVSFGVGGFEVPVPGGRRPALIRALNVLRQYDEHEVAPAWKSMAARLADGGLLVEGTCDEIGRIATWVAVDADGTPLSLTVSLRLAGLKHPSVAAERLPKALIHRNVPGERIHALLSDLDAAWERAAAVAPFGPVERWRTALDALVGAGWPVRERSRWRLGELTVPWAAIAPR